MSNSTINRLTPYRIFYNWSNGDYQAFIDDLTATGHFSKRDADALAQNTEAIIIYWVEKFPFFIACNKGLCCLEIQGQAWFEPLSNLWKLEEHLEDFLVSENYRF